MANLELYKIFYEVAKNGSLTKAAESLYISQPAITQAIKQLETQYGTSLFVRTRQGVKLSDTGGKQIFPFVEKAITILDDIEASYFDLKNSSIGTVKICASTTVTTQCLIPIIKEYHEKYPDINISISNGTSAETIQTIKDGNGDIGLVSLPTDDTDINLTATVMHLHDIFVASNDFIELTKGVVDLGSLEDYPMVMLEANTSTRKAIYNFTSMQGVQLTPKIEVSSIELLIKLAESGVGISCVPREFVEDKLKEGTLKEIKTDPELPVRAIGLATPKYGNATFAVREFKSFLTNKLLEKEEQGKEEQNDNSK